MVTGLQKYAGAALRQRGSSPKLLALNTGLISAQSPHSFAGAQADRAHWGRLVESAVGAHLANSIHGTAIELFYWRERNIEVDFVLRHGERLAAIEVKSGRPRDARSGLAGFQDRFGPARSWLVGSGGVELSEFLSSPAASWL
jgi:predicted AAA+ superfamily ATPase